MQEFDFVMLIDGPDYMLEGNEELLDRLMDRDNHPSNADLLFCKNQGRLEVLGTVEGPSFLQSIIKTVGFIYETCDGVYKVVSVVEDK